MAVCTEPLVNITSGPSGAVRVRTAAFAFSANRGAEHLSPKT